ncbi:hypothetical protein K491DRAFT_783785 [Lophiostoma macrostomum CBS 122681]|uniref:F-box domain-containing protein n=1 Tax=Lophiostoma macrostomum CBS 122681 TaxID=1314788 RepID=A0A6A6SMF9_9PLEO|nr:hypothetical protein K491DRAFT_783785 [Lophiostoma macrostomum CBS 122681]
MAHMQPARQNHVAWTSLASVPSHRLLACLPSHSRRRLLSRLWTRSAIPGSRARNEVTMMQLEDSQDISKEDPSVPPKEGTCVFFSIPQEVRDMIYEFALTYEFGITAFLFAQGKQGVQVQLNMAEGRCPIPEAYDPTEEVFNQPEECVNPLRLVSRQLYHETAWLELKFNHISFYSGADRNGLSNFSALVETCLQSWALHIKSVSLHSWSLPMDLFDIITNSSLARFCVHNPHIRLVLHLESLDFAKYKYGSDFCLTTTYQIHEMIQGSPCNLLSQGLVDTFGNIFLPQTVPSQIPL